jgi:hypothetical protein
LNPDKPGVPITWTVAALASKEQPTLATNSGAAMMAERRIDCFDKVNLKSVSPVIRRFPDEPSADHATRPIS